MYKNDFQSWGKGIKLVEGRPVYPQYTLKFKGKSHYKEQCEKSDKMWKDLRNR